MSTSENSNPRRLAQSMLVGLAALALIKAPPLDLGARLDHLLYDSWMRLDHRDAAVDLVVLELNDAAALPEALQAADRAGMKLAVSMVGSPASAPAGLRLLGPVATPDADGTMLVPSPLWETGGHFWLAGETDGVVRRDRAFLRPGTENLPSLAVATVSTLVANAAAPRLIDGDLFLGTRRWPMDADGRVWLRFYPQRPFPSIQLQQLSSEPARFVGRTLIVDQAGAPTLSSPVGELSRASLMAHAISGYLQNQTLRLGIAPALGWLIMAALVLVTLVSALRLRGLGLTLVAAVLVAACLGASALAWWAIQVWLPLAGTAALCATAAALAGASRRWTPQDAADLDSPHGEDPVVRARRLSARGRLAEAWNLYRRVELDASLMPELYRLGLSLEQSNRPAEARDVFRHMANLDPGFRDIQHRLLDAERLTRNPPGPATARRDSHGPGRELPPTLGRYEIAKELGRGAMGVVYLGRDPRINRQVAIKAIPLADEFDVDYLEEVRERFFREAETAGRLMHPNIVTIFDVGEDGDLAYIAMEYLPGKHLSDHAEPDRLLSVPLVLELAARTADALHYAHRQKVIHRDIKPANIMYDSASDRLKITDFGIARLTDVSRTRTGIVLGTPSFMSPEQLEGKNVNGHTDLFALGVSVYQLLTGQLPFRGTSMTKLMFAIANQPHERPTAVRADLPVSVDLIMERALAKKPEERFNTGAELATALRAVASEMS